MTDPTQLPPDLPRPVDDGACAHLPGTAMPRVALPSTAGRDVDLGALPPGRSLVPAERAEGGLGLLLA
ncbi:MAG TPA: hypothetical protein VFY87_07510, partial [Geminicoccaceae bacterium]|nr:hypothetical protein [Geminicoccaceae bacterium]